LSGILGLIKGSYRQASNQLGTPGGAKSFLRGAQTFWTMSKIFKLYPTHFSREGENFSRGGFRLPCAPSGYGPAYHGWLSMMTWSESPSFQSCLGPPTLSPPLLGYKRILDVGTNTEQVTNKYHKQATPVLRLVRLHFDWEGYSDECSGGWNFRKYCDSSR